MRPLAHQLGHCSHDRARDRVQHRRPWPGTDGGPRTSPPSGSPGVSSLRRPGSRCFSQPVGTAPCRSNEHDSARKSVALRPLTRRIPTSLYLAGLAAAGKLRGARLNHSIGPASRVDPTQRLHRRRGSRRCSRRWDGVTCVGERRRPRGVVGCDVAPPHSRQPSSLGQTAWRTSKVGWRAAMVWSCSSVASGPTPSKKMPTSTFHRLR
jgi:hypothetical protein